jgi:hypothetical protein
MESNMLTFTEYLKILENVIEESEISEASFISVGKKYTAAFGKYYCNGVEISKEAYARAYTNRLNGTDKINAKKTELSLNALKKNKQRDKEYLERARQNAERIERLRGVKK